MRKGKSSTEPSLERDEHDSAETGYQVLAVSDVMDRMSYHVKNLLLNILHEISRLVQCNLEDRVGQMDLGALQPCVGSAFAAWLTSGRQHFSRGFESNREYTSHTTNIPIDNQ